MAIIFSFSSTGNSLYVAKQIAEATSSTITAMHTPHVLCSDDMIGFVFPTYFMGLPKTVEQFIESLSISNKNAYIYSVTTYGDTTFHVAGAINNVLKKKGVKLSYAASIKCVENYLPMYPVLNDTKDTHIQTDKEIDQCKNEISAHTVNKIPHFTLLNRLIYSTYPAAKNGSCGLRFTIAPRCTGCGVCAAICQRKNISIQNGKPVFGTQCELCLGCLHMCPQQAIDWNGKTENRQRYRNPHISQQELISFMRQQ